MKVPLSRALAGELLAALLTPIGRTVWTRFWAPPIGTAAQALLVLFSFGLPSLYLIVCLLHGRTTFRVRSKVRVEEACLFTLPWTEGSTTRLLMVCTLTMAFGLYCAPQQPALAAILLGMGGIAGVATAIAFDHPRIWFRRDPRWARHWSMDGGSGSAAASEAFSYSETGFTAPSLGITEGVAWTAIDSIVAFKQDLIGVDRICVEIQLGLTQLCFSEDTPGFMNFMGAAEQHLPDFNSQWFSAVAIPAFETNLTTVFERRSAEDGAARLR